MNALARQEPREYASLASTTVGAGRDNPWSTWRIRAPMQALFLRLRLFDGERCGATFGLAGVQVDRLVTPVSFAARAVTSAATNSKFFLLGVSHHV